MKKWSKLLIAVLLVVCVISPIFTTASCEINPIYDPSDVDSTYLAEDMNDNWLLKLLAGFVFTVAGWAESILGNVFAVITGVVDFPWADKIVFNGVAVLDVNFISPAVGSYMQLAGPFILRIYWTMFTIALSLFGVLVLITAIKLAISTIASDKAKYKQALTSWVLGFVMLWTIHFLMAFLFYLNEQLVIEASTIANNSFNTANDATTFEIEEQLKSLKQSVNNVFKNYITGEDISLARFETLYRKYEDAYVYLYFTTRSNGTEAVGLHRFLSFDPVAISDELNEEVVFKNFTAILDVLDKKNANDYVDYINELDRILSDAFYVQKEGAVNDLLASSEYKAIVKRPSDDSLFAIINKLNYYGTVDNPFLKYFNNVELNLTDKSVKFSFSDSKLSDQNIPYINFLSSEKIIDLSGGNADKLVMVNSRTGLPAKVVEDIDYQILYFEDFFDGNTDNTILASLACVSSDYDKGIKHVSMPCVYADLREVIKIVNDEYANVEKKVSYITNLALYFKTNSYKTMVNKDSTIVKTDPVISNQIMYAILVVQSIMLFIAYMKRLFFVLLLSMLAPFVVVLDFFQKFGK